MASKFAKTPSLPGLGIYRLEVRASEKGDGTASWEGTLLEREVEWWEWDDDVESVDVRGCNRDCSLCWSSSSSSSSGSNDAARSNRSFRSSRGSNDENDGGRDEIGGVVTGTEIEE